MAQAMQDPLSGIAPAYATADFDFTAYLLTLHNADGSQAFQIADLQPSPRIERGGGSRGYFRFLIVQKCEDGTDSLVDRIKKIHGQYVNSETLVEPTDYMNKRRQLRTLLENKRTASNER